MKKIIVAALVLSTAFFFSCKSSASGDPKAVLSEFFDALIKKDLTTARSLATAESKSMLDLIEMSTKSEGAKAMDKYDKSKMEFGEVKIDGDNAIVAVKQVTSGETVNYRLKKEEGGWKVAFDKASLMTIGMDKMNEKGINPMDSLQKGMDELKKINVDSLKQGMEEGIKALDTLNKELKKVQ